MLRRIVAAAVVTVLGLVSAQENPTTASVCSVGCVNGVFVNAPNIGCANGDMSCVCGKTEFFKDGIRDCIAGACAPEGPDVQIPLAEAYADQLCASVAAGNSPAPSPTSSTAAPPPEATPTETTSSTTPAAVTSTSTSPEPTTESTSQVESTTSSSSASVTKPSTTLTSSLATSVSTSTSSSPTVSSTSQPAADSSTAPTSSGLSTAAKAGIGAGIGAAVLAAVIIGICVCLRRRQGAKTASRVRNYKISEPMTSSGYQFVNDNGRAQTTVPQPILTSQAANADSMGMPTSPTSLYSNSSDLEAHARRYEDMMPRTQPRTMI
ncbi:hypothetical protein F4802DRAFT_620654 [Xylaria palmicola]|nr:hypothetical protein F4802DRAFT_620654 [Xylaria palmicola]